MEVAAAGHRLNPKEPFKKPVKLKSDPLCRRQKRTMNRSRIGRTDSSLGLASKDAVSFQPKLQEVKKVKARGILLTLPPPHVATCDCTFFNSKGQGHRGVSMIHLPPSL